MRRIVVPTGIKFDRLHAVMQATMSWTNSHL
jgi:Plasmid pRiA4b ORF-3-like protein